MSSGTKTVRGSASPAARGPSPTCGAAEAHDVQLHDVVDRDDGVVDSGEAPGGRRCSDTVAYCASTPIVGHSGYPATSPSQISGDCRCPAASRTLDPVRVPRRRCRRPCRHARWSGRPAPGHALGVRAVARRLSRRVARNHTRHDWRRPSATLLSVFLMEFGDDAMMSRMLLGLRDRAETLAADQSVDPVTAQRRHRCTSSTPAGLARREVRGRPTRLGLPKGAQLGMTIGESRTRRPGSRTACPRHHRRRADRGDPELTVRLAQRRTARHGRQRMRSSCALTPEVCASGGRRPRSPAGWARATRPSWRGRWHDRAVICTDSTATISSRSRPCARLTRPPRPSASGPVDELFAAERIGGGKTWASAEGRIFCREDGSGLDPDRVSVQFRELCEAAGVRRVRLHDTRQAMTTSHAKLPASASRW
jgi:hypothetical protein